MAVTSHQGLGAVEQLVTQAFRRQRDQYEFCTTLSYTESLSKSKTEDNKLEEDTFYVRNSPVLPQWYPYSRQLTRELQKAAGRMEKTG